MKKTKTMLAVGDRFDRLEVIGDAPHKKKCRAYRVRCSCGTEKEVRAQDLLNGSTRSCGCAKRGKVVRRDPRNAGATRDPLYRHWVAMRTRVRVRPAYRGKEVCPEWQTFTGFREWARSTGYRPGLSPDRRDNAKGYEPSNIAWTDKTGQNRNRTICMDEETVDFARLYRHLTNMTQTEVGALFGKSATAISFMERGESWADAGLFAGWEAPPAPPADPQERAKVLADWFNRQIGASE